jgi:hypothetical protein
MLFVFVGNPYSAAIHDCAVARRVSIIMADALLRMTGVDADPAQRAPAGPATRNRVPERAHPMLDFAIVSARRLLGDKRGISAIEYGVLGAVVVVAVAAPANVPA